MAHSDKEWLEAKRKCRLNDAEIGMARQLGLNPRSLIKNIPSKSQQWKQPVGIWIREMYEEWMEKPRAKQQMMAAAVNTGRGGIETSEALEQAKSDRQMDGSEVHGLS